MGTLKLALLFLPALPGIIADVEAVIKDAEAKGESVDEKAKQTLQAISDLIATIVKLL